MDEVPEPRRAGPLSRESVLRLVRGATLVGGLIALTALVGWPERVVSTYVLMYQYAGTPRREPGIDDVLQETGQSFRAIMDAEYFCTSGSGGGECNVWEVRARRSLGWSDVTAFLAW